MKLELDLCTTPQNYEPALIKENIEKKDFPENTAVEYHCNVGYTMSNPTQRFTKCVRNTSTGLLEWTDLKLVCVPTRCPPLERPEDGELKIISGTHESYGSEIGFECSEGFRPWTNTGFFTSVCKEDGRWSNASTFFCSPVTCNETPIIENGILSKHEQWPHKFLRPDGSNRYNHKDKISFTCLNGYELVGHHTVECSKQGLWVPPLPKCIKKDSTKTCANPLSSSFKKDYPFVKFDVKGGIHENHEILFWCNDSDDKIVSKCTLKNGLLEWHPAPPKCTSKEINSIPSTTSIANPKNSSNSKTIIITSGILAILFISLISFYIYNNKIKNNASITRKPRKRKPDHPEDHPIQYNK